MLQLENENYLIQMRKKSGELTRIYHKKKQLEYLWNADPKFWGWHSPILFPVVGRLYKGKYNIDGKDYFFKNHGFAREYDFEVLEQNAKSLSFALTSSAETRDRYPFDFRLVLTYTLVDDQLTVGYSVENISDETTLPFSIGGHPAFNCPLNPNLQFTDYYLQFEHDEPLESYRINEESYFKKDSTESISTKQGKLHLTHELFQKDALIFKQLKSKSVQLRSDACPHGLTFTFAPFSSFAIWSMPDKPAPFICLEPWYGHSDYESGHSDFYTRPDSLQLAPQKTWQSQYHIDFF